MPSNYLKYFKSEFEKYAQEGPGEPPHRHGGGGGGAPATRPTAPPRQGGGSDHWGPPSRHSGGTGSWTGGGGASSATAIMAMQHALQDLAADVSKQINLQQMVNPDPNNPHAQEEAKSRDAFGTFLTKNYMRNTAVPGVEYDPDPRVRKVPDKERSADDPTRMSVVMDTMNRVGKEKSESFVDGNWGPRTNAAVRDAFAFGTGLFNFVDDVNRFATTKMQIQSYNRDLLKDLAKYATVDNSLTPEKKSEAAPMVTQHVKAIKNMYDEVKNKVLQHAAYRQFIESSVPYKTYETTVPTTQQIELLKKQFQKGFGISFGSPTAKYFIHVDDLLSAQKLQSWVQKTIRDYPELKGKATAQKVVDEIQQNQGQLWESNDPNQSGLLYQYQSQDPGY